MKIYNKKFNDTKELKQWQNTKDSEVREISCVPTGSGYRVEYIKL